MNTITATKKGIPTPTIFVEIHAMAEKAAGRTVAPETIRLTETVSYGGGPAFSISYTLPGEKWITFLRMPILLSPTELAELAIYMGDLERRAICKGLIL